MRAPLKLALATLAPLALLLPGLGLAQIDRHVGSDGVIEFSNSSSRGSAKSSSSKGTSSASSSNSSSGANKKTTPSSKRITPRKVFMPADKSAARLTRYDATIREAASLYHLPEEYIRAVMKTESNFDPRAVSPAGAVGLMQLMPFTAERMMVTDIFDPRQNIMGGARYLRILANMFNGDIHLTTAAYNAGEGAVIRYGGIPPYAETQMYVVKVLESYERYRGESDAR